MIVVREPTMGEWEVLREIRLAALQDAPGAFASTYVQEAAFQEADWRRRLSCRGTFFAYVSESSDGQPAGLAVAFRENSGTVQLVSLWVRPHARGLGLGEALVAAVIEWARAREATSVHLWLTEANTHARMLYERCGFAPTGERQPLPSKPSLTEVGMARLLLRRCCEGSRCARTAVVAAAHLHRSFAQAERRTPANRSFAQDERPTPANRSFAQAERPTPANRSFAQAERPVPASRLGLTLMEARTPPARPAAAPAAAR